MNRIALPCLVAFAMLACGGGGGEPGVDEASSVTIQWDEPLQRISGFGASSAWTAQMMSDELADQFFSAETGIGLSLLRVRLTPDGTTWEGDTARKAQARGASVWATPWTPPGAWKTSGTDNNGGRLLPERYQDWADRLTQTVQTLATTDGVQLMALSVQNEPNWVAEWETCEWSPSELVTFMRDYLIPTFAAAGLSTPLVAPETIGWGSLAAYADALLRDPQTRDAVQFVATHGYGGSTQKYGGASEHQKELWMTEFTEEQASGGDTGMNSALWMARRLHEDLTIGGVSAWHYWWLVPRSDTADTNAALLAQGALTRRAYALGNYSKFVRPGAHRLATSATRQGVLVTAFQNAAAPELVIVAVNLKSEPVTHSFDVAGVALGDVTPWLTSATAALEAQAPIAGAASFSYELPASSVVTFVASVQ